MADYFFPTVVQPIIPNGDMTPLERLLLMQSSRVNLMVTGSISLRRHCRAIRLRCRSRLCGLPLRRRMVLQARPPRLCYCLKDVGEDDFDVEFDLSVTSWEFVFQDIVKRSATLDHVSVVSAFTCSRMRPDGFGGMAILITADAISRQEHRDILCDFLDEAEHGASAAAPGFGNFDVLLCLNEKDVRAEIGHMIEADEALATISAMLSRTPTSAPAASLRSSRPI